MTHRSLPLRFLVVAASIVACSTSPDSKTSTNQTVDIFTVGDAFSPVFATVNAGDTVRWNFTGGSDGVIYNAIALVSFLAFAPIFLLVILIQKHLSRGLTMGAVKG